MRNLRIKAIADIKCGECDGTGSVNFTIPPEMANVYCKAGEVVKAECSDCAGDGYYEDDVFFTLSQLRELLK